jgi:quinol monooxygenase YgiN
MLIVAGTIALDSAKRAEVETAFDQMRDATLKEPGCLEYQVYLDRKEPGMVLIFERWVDEAALQAHFATPHMAAFGAMLANAGVKGTNVKKYEVAGESRLM